MQIKKAIPHLFTLGNLACGCISIYMSLAEHNLMYASAFVFGGMFLDFFDGAAARLLKVPGEFGKQLDSLADMVSFGVAPGMLILIWLQITVQSDLWLSLSWAAFLIPLFSALRLAKFNIDTRQTDSFLGLPTPANAIFWCTLPLALNLEKITVIAELWETPWETLIQAAEQRKYYSLIDVDTSAMSTPYWWVYLLIPIFSILMVTDLPLFSLKVKSLKWADNKIQFIFLGLVLLVLVLSWTLSAAEGPNGFSVFMAFPIIVVLYLVLSIINNAFSKSK